MGQAPAVPTRPRVAAVGIAVAADEELRASILGSEGRGHQDPEPAPTAEGALAGV